MNNQNTFRSALLLMLLASVSWADAPLAGNAVAGNAVAGNALPTEPAARLARLDTILASSQPVLLAEEQSSTEEQRPSLGQRGAGLISVPTWGWPGANGDLLRMRVNPLAGPDGKRREYRRTDFGLLFKRMLHGGDPDALDRHVDKGSPLEGTSWLNRPLHADWFFGTLHGSSPVRGHASLTTDPMAGVRFGRDFDHYLGWESRLAFSKMGIVDGESQLIGKDNRVNFYDLHLMNYPWGDATWRPYWSLGMGIATFRFRDDSDRKFRETLFHFPISIGLKHHTVNWMTLRLDLTDNIAFGSAGLNSMHNFSVTVGMEMRFGGSRRSYFPWKPDRYIW